MVADAGLAETSFFGRDRELRALTEAFEQARAGHGRLVAVCGDAGIGKSRLVEELVRRAGLPDGRVLTGRCFEQSGAPSYWPWMRVLRAYAGARGIDGFRADIGVDAQAFATLLPELLLEGAAAPPGDVGNLEARYRLFEATVNLLRVAASAPLLIVLEDVHWADEASLGLLELLAQELGGTRLLLLITYRDRDSGRLPRSLAEAVRRGERIALRGLDTDAVAAIVARGGAVEPSSSLVARLSEVTGGNPFFLGELLRTLVQEGRLDASVSAATPLPLPDSIRASIRRHLDVLGEADRELLSVAAVAGYEFDVTLLELATELPPAVVLERLEAPIAHGVVVDESAGRFRFAHALLRETLYGDIRTAARVRLHGRIGDALERLHGNDDAAPLGTLAHHFLHAALLGTAPKAVEYAARAARQAMAVYAYADAAIAYEQALAGLGIGGADRVRRLDLQLDAAEAMRLAGQDARARVLFRQAGHDARAAGDGIALFRAAMGYYQVSTQEAEPDPDTARLLEEALAAVGEEDSPARAFLLGLLAAARHMADGGFGHEALSVAAVDMARRLGDWQTLAVTLLLQQFVWLRPDSTDERLALCNEAIELTEGRVPDYAHAAGLGRTCCFLERGEVPAAIAEIERVGARADRLRHSYWRWQVGVQRAAIALLEGRFDDAARLTTDALAARRDARDPLALQAYVLQMFLARRDTGHSGGLEGSLRWMVERYPDAQLWRVALAVQLADMNRKAEARALFEELARHHFSQLRRDHHYPAMLAWLARVCLFLRDARRALELYPLLLPYADRNIVVSLYSRACLGSAHRYLALLCWAAGQADAASIHCDKAIAMNERMGARPLVACCQHEYARILQYRDHLGDRARAHVLLERARATARGFGMTPVLEWIDRLGPIEPDESADAAPVVATAAEDSRSESVAVMRRRGDVWEVGFTGETFHLKDARGMHLLVALLRQPGQEIHAIELTRGMPDAAAAGAVADRGDAGPLLDGAARSAYKQRLEHLRDELAEAEEYNDMHRATRAREEIDFLADELARGVGLGGRDRRAASAAERARVNATRTIGTVVRKIEASSPSLGAHLRATLRMGYVCVYAPDPANLVRWEL
jgi:hypothetical protein